LAVDCSISLTFRTRIHLRLQRIWRAETKYLKIKYHKMLVVVIMRMVQYCVLAYSCTMSITSIHWWIY